MLTLDTEPEVFADRHDDDELIAHFRATGYAVRRGLFTDDELDTLQHELDDLIGRALAGELDERFGSHILERPGATSGGHPHRHYLVYVTECSPLSNAALHHPEVVDLVRRLLERPSPWLMDDVRLGCYYQDSRAGTGSSYSRIGWHADWGSSPELDIWPGVTTTVHLDATSPANGFLRVRPGSHLRPTEEPDRFVRVGDELPVYCERGDVLFHHSHLVHSAARGSEDGDAGARRHLRGMWCSGDRALLEQWDGSYDASAAR